MRGDGTVYRRGRKLWIQYYWHGEPRHEPAGTDNEEEARRKIRRKLQKLWAGENSAPPKLTVCALLDDLVADQKLRACKAVRSLEYHAKPIRGALGALPVNHLSPAHVKRFIETRLAEKRKPATVNRETGVLGQALRLAQRRGIINSYPYIPHLKERNVREGFFEPDQFEALAATLPPVIADIARFGFLSGWRKEEILSLRWDQVDRQHREVRLYDSKSGEGRLLPLEGELWKIVERAWKTRAITPWVFQRGGRRWKDIQKPWEKACTAAGVPGRLFHDLRRTAIRNMVRAGADQKTVMSITGHKTVSVFLRYQIRTSEDQRGVLRRTQEMLADEARKGERL